MKKLCIMVMAIGVSILFSCAPQSGSPDSTTEPTVEIKEIWENDGCCHKTFTVFFDAQTPSEGDYYSCVLYHSYGLELIKKSEPIFLTGGWNPNIQITLQVAYYDDIDVGKYMIGVFGVEDYNNSGISRVRNTLFDSKEIDIEDDYSGSQCGICCTYKDAGEGRYYALLLKRNGLFIGSSADIYTRFGHLCGYPDSISSTATFAYTGVGAGAIGGSLYDSYWAQIGFKTERIEEELPGVEFNSIYAEVQGDYEGFQVHHDYNIEEYTNYNFKCSLDFNTGQWEFRVDNTIPGFYEVYGSIIVNPFDIDLSWYRTFGEDVSFAGELASYENDMPGTNEDRCIISKCKVWRYQDEFRTIEFQPSDTLVNDDPSEWGIYRDTIKVDSIEIWDKNPLAE